MIAMKYLQIIFTNLIRQLLDLGGYKELVFAKFENVIILFHFIDYLSDMDLISCAAKNISQRAPFFAFSELR